MLCKKETLSYVDNSSKSNDDMERKYTHSKTVQNVERFKQKMLLVQLQEAGIHPGAYILFNNVIFQSDDIHSYDSDCDDLPSEQATLIANLSNHNLDVISEVPTYNTYHDNHVFEQNVQEMQDCEQQAFVDDSNHEFTTESNMISYEKYLKENESQVVHNTPSPANQDLMIMSVIEQMANQVAKCNVEYKENQVINESLTAELERYKERDKTFEQILNIDLNSREKLTDSQMDDMIRDRLALKQQIDSLKQNLSNQIKEKESLLQTFTIFKNESKEKESKYMDKEIDLEKKIKELDNIVYKVGQFAQTVHTLTKPQVFYDDTHKQALGYQNPFYLKKAQRIKPTLYYGSVISRKHDVIFVTDEEETLILEELNKLSEDFRKPFVPQKELSAKQAFSLSFSNPNSEHVNVTQTPVRVEVPKELPKCSVDKKLFEIEKKELKLENERLLEHIICQDVMNIVVHADVKFDNVLPVPNTFLDDNISLDMIKMENDRLMELLVSQDLVHSAVNSLAVINDYQSMERSYIEEYEKNLKLAAELSQMNELSKTCSRLEQRCISLELELQHNKEIFKNDKPCENQDAPEFREFFIINELKAQLQANDTTISNLKKHIQELKGKSVADFCKSVNTPKVIAPAVLKLDLEPLSSNLKNNREAHVDYIRITKENADTLRDIVEQARISNPLDNALAYACMYMKHIQELLVYVSDTCPSSLSRSEKLVAVTPMNKAKKVTFAKTSTTSENSTQKRVDLKDSGATNKPLVPFTSVKVTMLRINP
ncbi:hypothetical protein Tco_1003055 [Tanacetum coccineum]|uniref:Uncharacterized protein n=1 Tax=Tanacetum coccineum TaxID=301880 RepID=A0ABQ5F8C3_9ASTR